MPRRCSGALGTSVMQAQRLQLVSTTGTEPLTLTEAKTHLRVTAAADDTYITELITAARGAAESFTGKTVLTKTFVLWLDAIPGASDEWWDGVRQGPLDILYQGKRQIIVPQPPLVSVQSITIYDDSDVGVVQPVTDYYVDATDDDSPGRIVLRRGAAWLPALRVANAIKVAFTAGYGGAGPVLPIEFKQAIKMVAQFLYRNRGDAAQADMVMGPCGASTLLEHMVIRSR